MFRHFLPPAAEQLRRRLTARAEHQFWRRRAAGTLACLAVVALLAACAPEVLSPMPCTPGTCPDGCCQDGFCLRPSASTCGVAGQACLDCSA